MKNLGTLLTEKNVTQALENVISKRPKLIQGTSYAIDYKGRHFPPKEIARIAARIGGLPKSRLKDYRLQGGPKAINQYFERLGFKIIQHTKLKRTHKSPLSNTSKRIVRLCWNENGWVSPSGWPGKSKMKNSHEAQYGYGHEEWLFDTSKLLPDGYHYGFIEPIREHIDLYSGQTFDVRFYSIDGQTKQRYWAGRIMDLQVLSHDQAEKTRQYYQSKGWLKPMKEDIEKFQKENNKVKKKGWSEYNGLDIFNVRFKPEALNAANLYVPIPTTSPLYNLHRYEFNIGSPKLLAYYPTEGSFIFTYTNKRIPKLDGNLPKKTRLIPNPIEMNQMHQEISLRITPKLWKIYGKTNVQRNHSANFLGREIDIVVNSKEGLIFYEIKTYNALIQSIRAAIGQLMEYAHWSRQDRAKKLVLITQHHENNAEGISYIRHIRSKYKIPLFYQSFDLMTNDLSEQY